MRLGSPTIDISLSLPNMDSTDLDETCHFSLDALIIIRPRQALALYPGECVLLDHRQTGVLVPWTSAASFPSSGHSRCCRVMLVLGAGIICPVFSFVGSGKLSLAPSSAYYPRSSVTHRQANATHPLGNMHDPGNRKGTFQVSERTNLSPATAQ